jgi:heavy metal sensor kinase
MKRKLPIGLRLTLWYLLLFALAQAIFGLGMWAILRHNLYDIADDALESQIDDVQRLLKAQRADATATEIQDELARTYNVEHSGDYLQIQDRQGLWIYRSPFFKRWDVTAREAAHLREPVYEDRKLGGKSFRFLNQMIAVDGRSYVVQMGVREGDVLETLTLFRRYLLLFAPLLLLAASGGGYWLSRRALSPVDDLVRTAQNITGTNLSNRLERLETGDELQRLSDTLNEMLARIESAFLRVSQFTADASHELRTPIALIRTEAEIALRKSRDEAEYREALWHVLSEAERTSTLVEGLLALARADAGRESLNLQSTDFQQITQEAARDWSPRIIAHHLLFENRVTQSRLLVVADAGALSRLLNILFDNAIKYTPAPGTIEVTLEKKGQQAVLAIRDTGIGIRQDDQAKIFERFYRADQARSRESGGSGLGLAIAQWIVEQHRGQVRVESSLGHGSTFFIELPLCSEPFAASGV